MYNAVHPSYQGEKVVLKAQAVHGEQGEVSDAWQQTLQHGRAVLDPVETHCTRIYLQK